MQFYGISFMDSCEQRQAHPAIDQTAYRDAWKKYHKTEGENLDVWNVSKTL